MVRTCTNLGLLGGRPFQEGGHTAGHPPSPSKRGGSPFLLPLPSRFLPFIFPSHPIPLSHQGFLSLSRLSPMLHPLPVFLSWEKKPLPEMRGVGFVPIPGGLGPARSPPPPASRPSPTRPPLRPQLSLDRWEDSELSLFKTTSNRRFLFLDIKAGA